VYGELMLMPEGKRTLGRPKCRLNDNIKMYRKEIALNIRLSVSFYNIQDRK
jgi:hypothetical protein